MEAFLFGPGERLFGAYYEGLGKATAPAVLICNGLGQDYMRGHLVLRHLAQRLSAVGGPVLLFDYRGTGDSRGEPLDNTLAGLREDAALARQELLDISGRPRAVTVGVRFGAWLALELGDRVVAWDPIYSGRDYVESLRALTRELCRSLHHFPTPRRWEPGPDPELVGYRYADRLLDELAALDLPTVIGDRAYTHLALVTGDDTALDGVTRALEGRAPELARYPGKAMRWNGPREIERSLTPFPALAELCETVSRW